jgi:hypothetical protein
MTSPPLVILTSSGQVRRQAGQRPGHRIREAPERRSHQALCRQGSCTESVSPCERIGAAKLLIYRSGIIMRLMAGSSQNRSGHQPAQSPALACPLAALVLTGLASGPG